MGLNYGQETVSRKHSFQSTEESLRELFSGIGEVESVKIITDADTGRSKGFGFIEMSSAEDAKKAIEQLNGKKFMERSLPSMRQDPSSRGRDEVSAEAGAGLDREGDQVMGETGDKLS